MLNRDFICVPWSPSIYVFLVLLLSFILLSLQACNSAFVFAQAVGSFQLENRSGTKCLGGTRS